MDLLFVYMRNFILQRAKKYFYKILPTILLLLRVKKR